MLPQSLGTTTDLWSAIAAAGPQSSGDRYTQDDAKEAFRRVYAYAVPTEEAINRIIAFADGPIVEIGAGRALWAHLIQLAGGTIRPTDIAAHGRAMLPENQYGLLKEGETWTEVECLSAVTAAREATEPTLLTIWPSYSASWTSDALKAFRGERVIYVGEGYGGCTADDAFHEELDARWVVVDEIAIPQWWGLHDSVILYRRKV